MILSVILVLATIYILYWFFIKFRISGNLPWKSWANFISSFPELVILFNLQNGIIVIIDILLRLIFLGLGLLIIYMVIPFAFLSLIYILYERVTVSRKNSWCTLCFQLETFFHLKHKKRMTGSEWILYKEKKEEEKKKFQNEKYSYHQDSAQEQTHNTQKEQELLEPSDLQKAMIAFWLNDLNFTEHELKRTRNKLIKSFHQDGSDDEEADKKHSQQINYYYSILKNYAKK